MKNLDDQLLSTEKPMEFARLRISRVYKMHQMTKSEYIRSLQAIGCVPNTGLMEAVEKSRSKN